MSYAGYPCKFCNRQRVEDVGDRHVCEKCRRDQATGERVPEPDPLDEPIAATRTPHRAIREPDDALAFELAHGSQAAGPLVWWLLAPECDLIRNSPAWLNALPEYLQKQVNSLAGRNPRGRLWVDSRFGDVEIPDRYWDNMPLASMAEARGGIVFDPVDAAFLSGLPGFFTDMKFRPAPLPSPPEAR